MHELIIPTINNNDTSALLVEWAIEDGKQVKAGETVAVLETTKSTYDLGSEADGILHTSVQSQEHYDFGATIGYVFADEAERDSFLAQQSTKKTETVSNLVITKSARQIIEEHNISEEQLKSLGKKTIKAKDLQTLIEEKEETPVEGETLPISELQQGIGRVVSYSHQTIPKSFILKKVSCDKALDQLASQSKTDGVMISLPDFVVYLVSRMPEKFPFFFGEFRDGKTFYPSKEGHIGVTFDMGSGLFIPVLRNATQRSLPEIAKEIMAFRMKALRNSFKSEELTGGDFSISINMDPDTLFVNPIILPPQTGMLSLGAVQEEIRLDKAGKPGIHRYCHLGLAYDHRVINGYESNAFLSDLKGEIE